MTLQNACLRPTSCGFDVVNGVPVQLQHVLGVRLLLLEAAHGKGELGDLDKRVSWLWWWWTCIWQRCTGRLGREQNIAFSTFSKLSSPLHRATWATVANNSFFRYFFFWIKICLECFLYPQCFMFIGLSILTAIFNFSSWSFDPLETSALYHSGACC